MELWIRSQDRHNLLKIDRLDVDDYTIQANFKAVSDDGFDYITIGRYKTNKRALEVLDEIQNLLMPQVISKRIDNSVEIANLNHVVNPTYETIQQLNTCVYEMPKE